MISLLAGAFLLQATYLDLYNDGYRLLDQGKFREAEAALSESASLNPGHTPTHKALGEAYAGLGALPEAISEYEKAVTLNPRDMQARARLAELYSWTGDHDKSIVTYRDALGAEPGSVALRNGLATVLRWSHRYEEAERLYKDVLSSELENHEALKGLAKTYSMTGDFPEAIEIFDRALALYQDDAELHKELGTVHAWQKDYRKGLEHIRRAVELSPKYAEAYRTMGDVYLWMKSYQESIEAYKKAADLEPGNKENYLLLARLYRQMDRKDMAEGAIKAALRIEPTDTQSIDMLRELRRGEGGYGLVKTAGDIVELAAFIFVFILLIFTYRSRRRMLLRRHRLYFYLINYILPALFVLTLVSFVAKGSVAEYLDPSLMEDITEAALFLALGMSLLTLLWAEHRAHEFSGAVVLAVGAHPDDIELGCGGYIMKAKDSGARVYGLTITRGEMGGASALRRQEEARKASSFMELDSSWVLDFPDTMLEDNIIPIKDALEEKIRETGATIVLTHTPMDLHSDHQAVFEATKVAGRSISVLCYEDVSTPREFVPNYFVDISGYMEDKMRLVALHRTQEAKTYMDPEVIKGRAAHRGLQAGVQYAEAYRIHKLLR